MGGEHGSFGLCGIGVSPMIEDRRTALRPLRRCPHEGVGHDAALPPPNDKSALSSGAIAPPQPQSISSHLLRGHAWVTYRVNPSKNARNLGATGRQTLRVSAAPCEIVPPAISSVNSVCDMGHSMRRRRDSLSGTGNSVCGRRNSMFGMGHSVSGTRISISAMGKSACRIGKSANGMGMSLNGSRKSVNDCGNAPNGSVQAIKTTGNSFDTNHL